MFSIASLILITVGASWFPGAHTVGLILLIPSAIEVLIFALWVLTAGKVLKQF